MRAGGRRIVARRAAMLLSGLLVVLLGAGLFGAAARPVLAVDMLPGQVECSLGDSTGPLPAGPHALSGVVTNASSAGVGGIRIYVSRLVGGKPFGREFTTTGSGGSWSFEGLGDATYIVGYYDGTEVYRNGWYSSTGLVIGTENATPITISGASIASIDLEIPVEAPLVLSGTIKDQSDALVSGIHVTATDVDFGFAGCADSDNGSWEMRVRTGRYIVQVQDFNGTYPNGFYDATNAPTQFTIAHQDASRLDLTVDTPGIDITYPPTYTIQGTVMDGVIPLDGISVIGCVDDFTTCTTFANTNESGEYILPKVVDGDWALRISDGSGTYRSGYRGPGGGVVPTAAGAAVTSVSGADVTGVAITTFRNATVSGTVTDSATAALPGIDVSVCDENQEFCAAATTTGAGYTTGGLPPNDYTVLLTDPTGDHPSGYLAVGGGITYDVGAALVLSVGDLDLTDVDAEIPDGFRISGTLTVNGTPGEGRQVSACLDEFLCVGEGNVDTDGSFHTPAVLPGTYALGTFGEDRFFYVDGADATTVFDDATGVAVVGDPVSDINFQVTELPPGADTEEGVNVVVFPEDPGTGQAPVQLTFDDVTGGGETWLSISADGPAVPAGFQLGDPPAWYDIETSATFVGNVEICISYGAAFADEASLRLLHYDAESEPPEWDDITTSLNVANDTICGLTNAFSPFVVARQAHTFGGFEVPVDDRPEVNRAKAGSSIPVTFGLGGDLGLAIFAEGFPKSGVTTCAPVTPDQIESTTSPGKAKLTYDPVTGLYTYIWKTDKSWAKTCRTLRLVFADGTEAEADFTFVR
jgi:hypothetical protein